jgi:ATP-dependent Lon protease
MAAYKAGIHTVIIPAGNACDVPELDEAVRQHIRFVPVEHMDQVIETALVPFKEEVCKAPMMQSATVAPNEKSAPPMMA